MSKPIVHANSSARRFGGKAEDYLPIHEKMDSSKAAHPTVAHRALYHHSMGPYMMQDVFGMTIRNSDGKDVCVRDVAEQHILEDMGFIPSIHEWLSLIPLSPWMAGGRKDEAKITMSKEEWAKVSGNKVSGNRPAYMD